MTNTKSVMPRTNAERQKEDRERKKASGLKRATFWIKSEWKSEILKLIENLKL